MIDYQEAAERWFGSIDRTALGRFAVDGDSLMLARAHSLISDAWEAGNVPEELAAVEKRVSESLSTSLGVDMQSLYGSPEALAVDAELFYFTSRSILHNQDELAEHVRFLTLVAFNDESYHDYFAVGITDTDFITKAISEGIDPEMALRMVA